MEDHIFSSSRISRKVEVDGISIPGIIQNGDFHLTEIKIFEDGIVDCWGYVDLPMLQEKIEKNWLVSQIPDGSVISIFGMGHWRIKNGAWKFDATDYFKEIQASVKKLNPQMRNLYNMHGSDVTVINGVPYSKFYKRSEKPYYVSKPHPVAPEKTYGIEQFIFYQFNSDDLYLTRLRLYSDGHVEFPDLPEGRVCEFGELEKLVNDGVIVTNPPLDSRIQLLNLGRFELDEGEGIESDEKYKELFDEYNELMGNETSSDKCLRTWAEYRKSPSDAKKEELRIAYENVPEQNKIFLGDQDTKDYAIRLAIYGDSVKKEWEDRYGFPMPNFD